MEGGLSYGQLLVAAERRRFERWMKKAKLQYTERGLTELANSIIPVLHPT